jgi:hypothetical protein
VDSTTHHCSQSNVAPRTSAVIPSKISRLGSEYLETFKMEMQTGVNGVSLHVHVHVHIILT